MKMLLQAFIFLIFVQLVSGTKISSIQLSDRFMDVKKGQRLLIPCKFTYDGPLDTAQIQLEWGMTPEDGGEFRPLIRLSDTILRPVKKPNPRAHLDPDKVQDGDCSIIVDSIQPEDIGTYKIRLTINGAEYKESPEIRVNMWKMRKTTGRKITNIKISKRFLEAKEGGQLVIPCLFNLNQWLGNALSKHHIKLEWGMTPEHGGGYQPLIRLSGNVQQPVKNRNPRAHLDLMRVSNGDCTMTIDKVKLEDSGTYKIFMSIDGEEYKHATEVMVNIKKHQDTTVKMVSSIQISNHLMEVKEGQRLLIPCKFSYGGPLEKAKIQLEWGMTPEDGGEFRPLIRLRDTVLEVVNNPNPRAHLDPANVRNGDCSIIIDSIQPDDIGTYKVYLTINGEFKHDTEVKVNMKKHQETTGTKISSIQLSNHFMDVKEGQQLLIPCKFTYDGPLDTATIQLQWGMRPEDGREFRPLIRLRDTILRPVKKPNPRAHLDPAKVQDGDCSIIVDSIQPEDNGIYKIRLTINGEEYKESPEIRVNVEKVSETHGAQITNIQILKRYLNAEEGAHLVIPCIFHHNQWLGKPLREHHIKLEWGMTPEHGGYQPLIRLSGNVQQPIQNPNPRVQMNLMRVKSGHCTITIDKVKLEDSGTYKVFMSIDGEAYKHATEVVVNIWKRPETPVPTSGHISQPSATHTKTNPLGSPDINPSVMEMAKLVQGMVNDGSIKFLLVLAAAIILLVLVIIGIAIYYMIQYYQLQSKYKDVVVQMEEGCSSGMTEDSQEDF